MWKRREARSARTGRRISPPAPLPQTIEVSVQMDVPVPHDNDRRLARDPIAIVGLAGKFPKAADVREFWDNIVTARDCSDEVPESWWKLDDHYDPDPFAEDKTYCRRGGFLTPEVFDPVEFAMPPKTVDSTGLVQLLALVVAKETLRDAGRGRESWYDPARTGVVLGVCGSNSTLIPLAARLMAPELTKHMILCGVPEEKAAEIVRVSMTAMPPWTEDSFPGILGNVVSGRIANRLNLGAANHTVDAACASSLAAVRSAVDELVGRRADLMLTGGCDADNSIVSFMCFSKTPALSPTGRARPFDVDADGTLVGEGIGMLALKRLDDAERDGDRVYAVLRGLGSSSDGNAQSIYAPCGAGQLRALRRAYEDADCPPASVELVEAHGTGTRAGDEVELSALNELLSSAGEHHHVAVGSVKSQIGHTKAAAGAAGLIKAALALHHKVLPPTANVTTPHPQAARTDSALYVSTTARPWVLGPARTVRRAGVSAFGFGGVNYHAVLEEHTAGGERRESAAHRTARACLWHAPDTRELRRMLEGGAAPQEGPVPPGHARVGFVDTGPERYERLLALAVGRLRDDGRAESWSNPSGVHYRGRSLAPETKVGALFAGQGSQYAGMGLHAALAVPPVRAAFDAANALFPHADSLAAAVFPPPGTSDAATRGERLRRTAYAQSAIGALSMGQYRYLRELGLNPHGLLGHSFGELSALWAAEVLDDDAFTALARARGLAMEQPPGQETDPGAMAAVRTGQDALTELLAAFPELVVCNRNAPDEHVVGGPTAAVRRFVERCAARGAQARELSVAAAFHTAHVRHAAEVFEKACAQATFSSPAAHVYADTAGAVYGDDAEANRRTLVGQLLSPVDFAARVEEMYADGVRVFVEFGPGRTLTQLVGRILGGREAEAVACDAGAGSDSDVALKEAAVRLVVAGLPLTGINRYDAPPPPEPRTPSKAARSLDGPLFAVQKRRPVHDRLLAEAASAADRATDPRELAGGRSDPLTRATTEFLTAHTRYLDNQVRTAEHLTELLRKGASDGRLDDSLAAAVNEVTEVSLAMGQAHVRAGEVVTELLRLPQGLPDEVTEAVGLPGADELPRPPHQGGSSAPGHEPAPDRSALAELWDAQKNGVVMEAGAPMDISEVDFDELEREFRTVIADKTGYDLDMIEPDMYIQADLGIDSLKQVEIGAEMWRRYPVIARSEMYRFSEAKTVRELTDLLRESFTDPKPQLRIGAAGGPARLTHVALRELPAVDVCDGAYAERPRALLLDDGGELPAMLAGALAGQGWHVLRLCLPTTATEDGTDVRQLEDWTEETAAAHLAGLLAAEPRLDLCVLPVSRRGDEEPEQVIARLRHAILMAKHVRPALETATGAGRRGALVTVTRLDGALGYAGSGGDTTAALAGGLGGLVKTLALEATTLFCRALDFAPDLPAERLGEAFMAEIADVATGVREVGVDDRGRRAPELSATPWAPSPSPARGVELTEDDLLVVTGGARGITAWCVEALAREHRCGYLLLGRTPLEEEPAWATGLDTPEELRAALEARAREAGEDPEAEPVRTRVERHAEQLRQQREIRDLLTILSSRGVEAGYAAADVRDAAAVAAALAPHRERVTGVLHGAGVLRDRPLTEVTADSVAAVVDTKLTGLHHVLSALDPARLRHLVLFSSVSGLWGNLRQSDYALANESLNRFGCAFQAARPGCRVLPLAWGPWSGGMAAPVRQVFTDAGVPVLSREEGGAHFRALMAPGGDRRGVAFVGPATALYQRLDKLPAAGVTAHREVTGLGTEPVLRDHSFRGVPVLPMTAAVGWAVHTLELAHGGSRTVHECRDFRIAHGLSFPDGHPPRRFRVHLAPEAGPGPKSAHVTVHDTGPGEKLHYEGRFLLTDEAGGPGEAPCMDLPPFTISDEPHPGYTDGRLFHGPSLAGLRDVLEERPGHLVVAARMPDPELARGAYAGRLYSPALADLLLQTALLALLALADGDTIPVPVSVGCLELFSPLPDDEAFVITADIEDSVAELFSRCTLTACAPDGRVHQRWCDVRTLWLDPAVLIDGLSPRGQD